VPTKYRFDKEREHGENAVRPPPDLHETVEKALERMRE
jgi:hypothetical protein